MADKHLSNEEFFAQLKELFDARRTKDHGTVYLTQKRLTFDLESRASTPAKVADDPLWDTHPPSPLPIIVRATNGKSKDKRDRKVKLSTVVPPDRLEGFYARYADVCKAGMAALKPRDRSKRKKDKRNKKKNAATAGGAEGEKKA
ncbi:signal recognition particle 14kd protein [Diplodia corticola]|uniref:Signal recognition particle subunit SRP14 n=1 Tax=Diplodia corticola TaxID=236234 RepID=A0A1J9RWA2_9PEZI|nr:signal recognition particle 14kd protein [Diplodia corticola]OJD32655.1 signal recognition particle 14kd protein [Diplodia corticola]